MLKPSPDVAERQFFDIFNCESKKDTVGNLKENTSKSII